MDGATLPHMLRDRLVCGVNDDRMQRRLLALNICQPIEFAYKNVRDLQWQKRQNAKTLKVHRVHSAERKGRQKDVFYRCKGQHSPEECRFLNELCHKRGKRGHIKWACSAKQASAGCQKTALNGQKGEKKQKGRRTHLIREEESDEREDTSDINTICTVSQVQPKVAPITPKVMVNGVEVWRSSAKSNILSCGNKQTC